MSALRISVPGTVRLVDLGPAAAQAHGAVDGASCYGMPVVAGRLVRPDPRPEPSPKAAADQAAYIAAWKRNRRANDPAWVERERAAERARMEDPAYRERRAAAKRAARARARAVAA